MTEQYDLNHGDMPDVDTSLVSTRRQPLEDQTLAQCIRKLPLGECINLSMRLSEDIKFLSERNPFATQLLAILRAKVEERKEKA